MQKQTQKDKIDLLSDCSFVSFGRQLNIDNFDCGDADLNDFFKNDALSYQEKLIGKTHAFVLDSNPTQIVSAFTVSNDALRVDDKPKASRKNVKKDISPQKIRWASYPAVKIGRLGVSQEFSGYGVGSQVLDFVKGWFCEANNKTGCRFITIDAYNNKKALSFYEKNEFDFLFSSAQDELNHINSYKRTPLPELNTRFMFFDLMRIM